MAVTCPGCGRQYDVTLFDFGRTVTCTCGARVGRDMQIARPPRQGPARFSCDAMLGRLARWLRALGFDTAYEPDVEDSDLVRSALEEGRTILTRDRRLAEEWRVPGCVVLETEDPAAQLRELVRRLDLEPLGAWFRRCLECNEPLREVDRDEVRDRVPERVLARVERYRLCPVCDKVYWEGSHTRRLRRELTSVIGEEPRGGAG